MLSICICIKSSHFANQKWDNVSVHISCFQDLSCTIITLSSSIREPFIRMLLLCFKAILHAMFIVSLLCSTRRLRIPHVPQGGPMFLLCFARRIHTSHASLGGSLSLMFLEVDSCTTLFLLWKPPMPSRPYFSWTC